MDIHSKNPLNLTTITGNLLLDYLLVAACPLLIYILAIFSFGPGITNDSVNYLAAALSLDEGMLKADSSPFFEWPPLYPVLLSPANFNSILTFAAWLNGVVFALNNILIYNLIAKNVVNKRTLLFTLLILTFSTPMIQIHIMIWSEPFFITLLLLNIYLLNRYIKKTDWATICLLSLIGVLLFLQRKSGILITATTILFVLFFTKRKFFHLLFYMLICAVPVIWWYWRRVSISGKFFGHSELVPEKFFVNLEQVMNTFSSYLLPMQLPLIFRVSILLLSFIVIIFLLKNSLKKVPKNINWAIISCVWFSLSYYFLIVVGLIYLHLSEEIDDRILIPVYPLFLIIFIYLIDKLFTLYFNSRTLLYLTILIFGWLIYPTTRTIHHLIRWNRDGTGGYNSLAWNVDPIITELSNISQVNTVYANHVNALYYQLRLARQKNILIKPSNSMDSVSGKSLLVCFGKNYFILGEDSDCYAQKWENKKKLFESESGTIWELQKK